MRFALQLPVVALALLTNASATIPSLCAEIHSDLPTRHCAALAAARAFGLAATPLVVIYVLERQARAMFWRQQRQHVT